MSKYRPLYNYLRRKAGPEVEMSFADIERVIGVLLPKSASRPQWWANERSPLRRDVQRHAWLDAGYDAFASPKQERVTFRKKFMPAASRND